MPGKVTGNMPFGGPGGAFPREVLCFGSLLESFQESASGSCPQEGAVCFATECGRSHVPCRSQRTGAHGNHEEKPLLTKLTWCQLTKDQVLTGPHYTDADLEVKDCLGAEWQ